MAEITNNFAKNIHFDCHFETKTRAELKIWIKSTESLYLLLRTKFKNN